jgi:hypothetical protein
MPLVGLPQLKKRIQAIAKTGDDLGRDWANATVDEMRGRIPTRTGATRESVRVGHYDERGAEVVASPVVYFLDSGTREHEVTPKIAKALRWSSGPGGKPVFSRSAKIPRQRPRPLRDVSARAGLEKTASSDRIVRLWNEAA